ncbi:MAG: alanine--tRNA ligase, partial [Bacteroidota bacterium]
RKIRQEFLNFFQQKAHEIVKSAPIVVKDDPTLMFTNAGMNQFKDIFLGIKDPSSTRVADTQKCLRVSGKHNDLEEVGHDTYHHTMFEMLGNWSFGDYYKKEAISWAWELLTEVLGLDPDRMYVTIFEGSEPEGVSPDEAAHMEWRKYVQEDRILKFGKKDNFWEMGEVGPSGPCSEIHIDLRSEEERSKIDGATLVNADHPQVVEIWNLVFIQYNRKADGSLESLPQTHVDTGMGFERLLMVLQNKKSTYDTDLFDPAREFLAKKTGITYEEATEPQQIAMRVIMDHIRAIAFTIADGQIPSNTGAGYVIRRILRRASRYGFTYLNLGQPFMYEMIDLLEELYNVVFEELTQQKEFIKRIVLEEEKSFLSKLERGSRMFEEYLRDHRDEDTIDGVFAFRLYDTFGFPIDLTQLMAREKGRMVDMEGFQAQLEAQKSRSRAATELKTGDWVEVNPSSDLPRFLGYDALELDTRILSYREVQQGKKKAFQLVLEETPFYAESGGQIGDRGMIIQGDQKIRVLDTKKENELIVHLVDKLPQDADGTWRASVSPNFRKQVTLNHTATHLMHAALRETLGTHVEQRGSLVSDKLLRFDFSHFERVKLEELQEIEQQVNARIAQGIRLEEYRDMPIGEAKAMGAMALFGEKYGDNVRLIVFDPDYSVELCGGTHVQNTQEIQLFKFISESSSAAGIRRVEALTGTHALAYLNEQQSQMGAIHELLRQPKNTVKAIEDLIERNRQLEKELQALNAEKVSQLSGALRQKAEEVNDIRLIREVVRLSSSDDLKQLSFELKRSEENTLILLGAEIKGKPQLSLIMTDDLASSNRFHAGNMVRELAREIKGGGGGQPFYATAGGKDATGLPSAISKIVEMI